MGNNYSICLRSTVKIKKPSMSLSKGFNVLKASAVRPLTAKRGRIYLFYFPAITHTFTP